MLNEQRGLLVVFSFSTLADVSHRSICQGWVNVFFFEDFEHHPQIFVGNYIPNSWVMFNWDIDQPLFVSNRRRSPWWISPSVSWAEGVGRCWRRCSFMLQPAWYVESLEWKTPCKWIIWWPPHDLRHLHMCIDFFSWLTQIFMGDWTTCVSPKELLFRFIERLQKPFEDQTRKKKQHILSQFIVSLGVDWVDLKWLRHAVWLHQSGMIQTLKIHGLHQWGWRSPKWMVYKGKSQSRNGW